MEAKVDGQSLASTFEEGLLQLRNPSPHGRTVDVEDLSDRVAAEVLQEIEPQDDAVLGRQRRQASTERGLEYILLAPLCVARFGTGLVGVGQRPVPEGDQALLLSALQVSQDS